MSDEDEDRAGRVRKGTMSKNFKFPSPHSEVPPPLPDVPTTSQEEPAPPTAAEPRHSVNMHNASDSEEASLEPVGVIAPSVVEVPPPPPVEKERVPTSPNEIGEDEVGETEEISLN